MQVVLAIVVLPFAFWGINFYERGFNLSDDIAKVNGQKITEQEFTDALRQQQDRMRNLLGRNFNPALFESPEMRRGLLEGLISQRLVAQFAFRRSIGVSDEQLRDVITSIPAFQEDGRFSKPRYEAMLRAEGYSTASFEASLRRDLMTQQLTAALSDAGMASKTAARQVAQLRAQQREIAEYVIAAEPEAAQAKITSEAVRAFYDANPARFQLPEEVRVEYVVLNNDALVASEQVSLDDIKAYYESNAPKFGEPEQRRASHILVSVKSGASEAEKAKARERAARILAQVRKSPGSFAELAKKNSDDPGSASKGGDLGFFSRGMMVRPFEDAAFRLKPNQIGDLVESDFGFHIIRITGVKAGKMKSLGEARPENERELKRQRAGKRFAEAAEAFSNLVYEQADSLKPAAERFRLPIQLAQGVTRQSASLPALNNPKLLAALFADDSIKNRRNTEAVEAAGVRGGGIEERLRDLSRRPRDRRRAGRDPAAQRPERAGAGKRDAGVQVVSRRPAGRHQGGNQQSGSGKKDAVGKLPGSSGTGYGAHHRIESTVHVGDLTRHPGRQVGQQKRRYVAHVLRRDVSPQGRILLDVLEDLAESRYSARRESLDRAGRDRVDANPLRSETRGQIAHARLEARLVDAHGVVARHDPICSEVGEGYQCSASSLHERQRRLGERRKAVAADVVRDAERLARQAVEKITRDRFARRKGDRVHQAVERVPAPGKLGKERGDLGVVRDVAGKRKTAAELARHLGDAVLEALVLVGERELRALAPGGLGDAIGDRTVGEQARDQDALAREKTHLVSAFSARDRGIVADSGRVKSRALLLKR